MRAVAVILLVLCLAAIGLTGYLYFTANVVITEIECVAVDASDQEGLFASLKAQIAAGTFTGTPFQTSDLGAASGYQFFTYKVHVVNSTFVKAEVAELQVTPMNGDVLQMEETQARNIQARRTGMIEATILTTKAMHNVRELTITYYLWGLPFSVRVTYTP